MRELEVIIKQLGELVKDPQQRYVELESLTQLSLTPSGDEAFVVPGEVVRFLTLSMLAAHEGVISVAHDVERGHKFGYAGLDKLIQALAVADYGLDIVDDALDKFAVSMMSMLNTDVTPKEYIDKELYLDDIEWVNTLLSDVEVESINDQLVTVVLGSDITRAWVNRAVDNVMNVYEKTFAVGFDLDPFAGVFTFGNNPSAYYVAKSNKAVLRRSSLLKSITNTIKPYSVKNESKERQWDIDLILDNEEPVAFPLKVAEYAFGKTSPVDLDANAYYDFKLGSGWRTYADRYLRGNVEYFIALAVAKVLSKEDLIGVGGFTEDPYTFPDSTKDRAQSAIDKVERSMVSVDLLVSAAGNQEAYAEFTIRMVNPDNIKDADGVVKSIIKTAFGDNAGVGLGDGNNPILAPLVEQSGKYRVYDFKHTFDVKLANVRPLFAYRALDAFKSRGETPRVDNMVLGLSDKGAIVKSEPDTKLDLLDKLIHILIAGSRAGKGVMTLNVLAANVASERAIFYLDRKPDMASLLASIVGRDAQSKLGMFLVNGGDYQAKFDNAGVFDISNMTGWDKNIPSWHGVLNYTDVGDLVYFRAIQFVLGILALRTYASGKPELADLYEQLNGSKGVTIVIDEFTNWQSYFSTRVLNPSGDASVFSLANMITPNDIQNVIPDLEIDLRAFHEQGVDNLKPNELKKYNAVMRQWDSFQDPKRIYYSDLFNNYQRTMSKMHSLLAAGMVGGETKTSDIFVIGQNLDVAELPDSKKFFTFNSTNDKLLAGKELQGTCPISTYLYSANTNFLMGYNQPKSRYMFANDPSSIASKKLTGVNRNFAFYEGSIDDVKGENSKVNVNDLEKKAIFFKPFLILNNSNEPDIPDNATEDQILAACQIPKDQYVGGVVLNTGDSWKDVRAENLKEDGSGLRDEIGFFSYIDSMMEGKNTDISKVFGKSAEIANLIVKQMGYEGDWEEFLLDLRPEWNFSAEDMVLAFEAPELFAQGKERLKTLNFIQGRKLSLSSLEGLDGSSIDGNRDDVEFENVENDNVNLYEKYDHTKEAEAISMYEEASQTINAMQDYDIDGGVVELDVMGGEMDLDDFQEAETVGDYFLNFVELSEKITIDMIQTFGGYDQIKSIMVRADSIYINDVKFSKSLSPLVLRRLPADKMLQAERGAMAGFINYAHLSKMPNLTFLNFHETKFLFTEFRVTAGFSTSIDANMIFREYQNLKGLVIGNRKYDRDVINEVAGTSVFTSAKRRAEVGNNFVGWGSKTTTSTWGVSRSLFSRGGFFGVMGGVSMLGLTSVVGGATLGAKGFREISRGIKDLFKTVDIPNV